MNNSIGLIIEGRPVPYVRMTQRGKYVKKNAQRYLDYKNTIAWMYKGNRLPKLDGKLEINVIVYLHGKTTPMGMDGDVDNYIKTAMDSLNGIAYDDDRQVVRAIGEKKPCKHASEQRMEIKLREVG